MKRGPIKSKSKVANPLTGSWTKRDDRSGKFMYVKADPKPFKGVRKTKGKKPRIVSDKATRKVNST